MENTFQKQESRFVSVVEDKVSVPWSSTRWFSEKDKQLLVAV